jgi:hypothetical protein
VPWNKGKLIGQKPPLRSKHVWSIRTKLQIEARTCHLAMFNLAIDSKLRGCDLVAVKVEDVAGKRGRRLGAELSKRDHRSAGATPSFISLEPASLRTLRWIARGTYRITEHSIE